jgi:hypothetical protein
MAQSPKFCSGPYVNTDAGVTKISGHRAMILPYELAGLAFHQAQWMGGIQYLVSLTCSCSLPSLAWVVLALSLLSTGGAVL